MRTLLLIYITLFTITAKAQNKIELILTDIEKNNKAMQANKQYWEAKKLQFKSGINPSNPKLEYEFLTGSPSTAGNQTDILVVQSFDFPTAYSKKNQVANQQIIQSDFYVEAYRQNILMAAKEYCLELTYLNKKQTELVKRVDNAKKLQQQYQLKLELGDANSLDANKATLNLINLQNELRLTTSEINQYTQRLTELNGGTPVEYNETTYPISPLIPTFEALEKSIEENDPNLKSIHQQNEIDQKKVELSRAMFLPKLEGGYRLQKILGQTFKGVYAGITIPLWESKNSVKHQKAHLLYNNIQVEEHHNEHYYEIKQLYEKYENLNIAITEYQNFQASINNIELLNKALALGEISSISYFMEINYFYDSFDNYLFLEKELNITIAKLLKYQL